MTDQSGAVLPGVTVTATSPALQVPQVTDVTNELGEYRLAPLPIGVYQVAFDLSGFRPAQRQDVRLTVGFTARIDVSLGLATVAETVTVSGAAPVVDVTSTTGSTLLTQGDARAHAHDAAMALMSLLTLAPGVRTLSRRRGRPDRGEPERARVRAGRRDVVHARGDSDDRPDSGSGSGVIWDYANGRRSARPDASAPMRSRRRAAFRSHAIVKSGGNDFHGGGFWAQNGPAFQSDNLDDELRAQGIETGNTLEKRYDVGGDLGGRIIRNKLWFYGARAAALQRIARC